MHRRDDGSVVAGLIVTGGDFPWLHARVDAREGFAGLRPLFAEQLRQLDRIDDDAGGWEKAYGAVRNAVTLHDPQGRAVAEFLLHVDGDGAWWRWADQPFGEDR